MKYFTKGQEELVRNLCATTAVVMTQKVLTAFKEDKLDDLANDNLKNYIDDAVKFVMADLDKEYEKSMEKAINEILFS